VDYLYASVLNNNVSRDPAATRMSFQYKLRNAQVRLDQVNEDIENTQRVLDSYKNDEIYITMQDSGDTKTTTSATDNYNNLVLQQADNYSEAEKLSADIANLKDRIALLDTDAAADIQPYNEELERVIERCKDCYSRVKAQMQEIQRSPFFTTYLQHSTTSVSSKGFIAGAGKKMVLGGVAGLFIGLGLWFIAALAPEYRSGKKQTRDAEEVAEQ
jgi:small nuclear ribonucleoprotein (snRNP)-like protein